MSLDIFLLFLISKVNFFKTDFLNCENNLKVLFFKVILENVYVFLR